MFSYFARFNGNSWSLRYKRGQKDGVVSKIFFLHISFRVQCIWPGSGSTRIRSFPQVPVSTVVEEFVHQNGPKPEPKLSWENRSILAAWVHGYMHWGQYDPDYIVEQRKKNYVIHMIHTYNNVRNSMAYYMCGECANVYADVCLFVF